METTITIGRTLDSSGQPIIGTGVDMHPNSPTAQLLLAQRPLLFTNPITREVGAVVHTSDAAGHIVTKGLGILPPSGGGPPLHVHPSYEEEFEVVEGQFSFILGKQTKTVRAGEKAIVPPGMAHTFKPLGNTISSFLVEARPAGKLNEVVHTIFGLAHDGKLDKKGRPNFWQGMALGTKLSHDTMFTSPPPAIQRLLFKLFGKAAAKRGYKAIYPEYMEDAFWLKRVQQLEP